MVIESSSLVIAVLRFKLPSVVLGFELTRDVMEVFAGDSSDHKISSAPLDDVKGVLLVLQMLGVRLLIMD